MFDDSCDGLIVVDDQRASVRDDRGAYGVPRTGMRVRTRVPVGLVVKKSSVARSAVRPSMPTPVS